MSSLVTFREVVQALLPKGPFWNPLIGGFYDKILEGISLNTKSVYEYLKQLAFIRDPSNTPILSDLEKEYGIVTDLRLSDEERQNTLAAVKYAKPGKASFTDLQTILRDAGFDVYVYQNNPPIDPATLLDEGFQMVANGDLAFAGDPEAYAGLVGHGVLVNGPNYDSSVLYEMMASGAAAFAGEPAAIAGYFLDTENTYKEYEIPAGSERWPYIFFIGGERFGWITLKDWNMEKPVNIDWKPGPKTTAKKDTTVKESGVRSLKVSAINQNATQIILPEQPDASLKKSYGLREVIGGFAIDDAYYNFLAQDGDMERTGVTFWVAGNGAILTKDISDPYSGLQCLRITKGGASVWPYAGKTIVTVGQTYRARGRFRGDGVSFARLVNGATTLIASTTSNSWQDFDVTFVAGFTTMYLYGYVAGVGYAEFDDISINQLAPLVDGDMETAGVGAWSVGNGATLTKSSQFPRSGSQCLRIEENGTPIPFAFQTILDTHSGANDFPYRLKGWARSVDGLNVPLIMYGSLVIWTGTLSTNWQYFETVRLAPGTDLKLMGSGNAIVEFDDIEISPVLGAVGVVTGTSFEQTALGPARRFNGSSDFITGGAHVGLLGYELDDRFTLSAWLNVAQGAVSTCSIISRNTTVLTQWDWVITVTGQIYFIDGVGNYINGQAINTGQLVHVAVVIDGANSQHYFNGQPVGSTFNPTITKQAVATLFGAYDGGAGRFFDGVMVAPQIYSEAKTASWIQSQYLAGKAAQLEGSYVEQLVETDLLELPVSGFAWSDNVDGVPCIAVLDSDDVWEIVWVGTDTTGTQQPFSVDVLNGIKGIRLYNKFCINGYANFDDIDIMNPSILKAQIPAELQGIFERLILKYKPLHGWAGLIVEYI